ncbi:hypothetical protein WISP_125899 [Willisornis vidua]|uniref:Uncharacterized protein n=1 Tax=Willisornis vidua TaxID=1566151 RepID=A0ABQ9CWI7_9PASS|nr:hypothetical protein WISP_125899 [Willisornis vidua]
MQKGPFLANIAKGRRSAVPFVTRPAHAILAFLATSTFAASVDSALPKSSFTKPSHDDDDMNADSGGKELVLEEGSKSTTWEREEEGKRVRMFDTMRKLCDYMIERHSLVLDLLRYGYCFVNEVVAFSIHVLSFDQLSQIPVMVA